MRYTSPVPGTGARHARNLLIINTFAVVLLLTQTAGATEVKVWHELGGGEGGRVKAEGILEGNPAEVWKTLIRFNDYAKFMPRVVESFFVSEKVIEALKGAGTMNSQKLHPVALKYKIETPQKEGAVWEGVVFMILNMPFPVENRWYLLRVRHDETKGAREVYSRCWNLIMGNIDHASGCWHLTSSSFPGQTMARYEDEVDPGGKVPEWAVKAGATQTVPEMFQRLEREVVRVSNQGHIAARK